MLTGAMVSALVGSLTQNAWIGLLAAIIAGALLALVHAVLSIKYKTNQIVSGTVINIFATGVTSYISAKFLQVNQALNNPPTFGGTPIPLLSEIPILGPVLFSNSIFVYVMFILLVILHIALFQTRWGLRLRAVESIPKPPTPWALTSSRLATWQWCLAEWWPALPGGTSPWVLPVVSTKS